MKDPVVIDHFLSHDSATRAKELLLSSEPRIESLRQKQKALNFGAAYYAHPKDYLSRVQEWGPRLKPFESLFEETRARLERVVKGRIRFFPEVGPAGFHIFNESYLEGAHIHADGQVFGLSKLINQEFHEALTSVFSICLPSKGGGINFWRDSLVTFAKRWGSLKSAPPAPDFSVELAVGRLVLFDSKMIHQIASFQVADHGEPRITMVAHLGRIQDDEYVMFW